MERILQKKIDSRNLSTVTKHTAKQGEKKMKKKIVVLSTGLAILGMAGMAQATLTTIGTATYNNSDYNLIWDDDNNGNSVVWLDYTNDQGILSTQNIWVDSLQQNLTYNIDAAYSVSWDDDWRLGSTVDGAWQYGDDGTTTGGFNITSSEMGHLFYEELGNLGYRDTNGTRQLGYGLQNTGAFEHLIEDWYWSGTEYATDPNGTWSFYMNTGYQYVNHQYNQGYGLALRNGHVSAADPVPEPATMLLFSTGLVGLAGYRRKRKGKSA